MRLIFNDTGESVTKGTNVLLNGECWIVNHFTEPHKPSSSGKVHLLPADDINSMGREFFVSVINAKWIDRGDK